jgi:hypothetical protein
VNQPTAAVLDLGYVFGLAKGMHKPVFVDYRGDATRDDYPATFSMADGVGFGVEDLSLFIDTYDMTAQIADEATRARVVANKIKRLRIF